VTAASAPPARLPLTTVVADILAVTRRNLIVLTRIPAAIVFTAVQPIILVLMFRYVFGGAIGPTLGSNYVDFLMAGIFVQTVTFGAMGTGVGLATDVKSGLIERFRSLPMARSAVLLGRLLADAARNVGVICLMVAVGFLVGFRIHAGIPRFLLALLLILLFGVAMSAVMALIGLSVPDPESAQAAAFPFIAVFIFASSAFVPTYTMPGWLRAYAEHQPVSDNIEAVRVLILGGSAGGKILVALAWTVGITLVFSALAVRRYRRVA
jgi:ABC-2 type transport system permease protein/oleandomycin transport system permease protein